MDFLENPLLAFNISSRKHFFHEKDEAFLNATKGMILFKISPHTTSIWQWLCK